MAEMLSPGVYTEEIDASAIVTGSSSTVGVFSGRFFKGQVGQFTQITNVQNLIDYYGYPTDENYNDWFQCYNFLQYGKNLLVSRACNTLGSKKLLDATNVVQVGVDVISVPGVKEVKSSCEIATSKLHGTDGNNITIDVQEGEPEVTVPGQKADCEIATAKEDGTKYNTYTIIVEGSSLNWTIKVNDGVSDLFSREGYDKDTILNTDLVNPYVEFKNVALSAKTHQLEGGVDELTVPRYNVITKYKNEVKDTQENKKSTNDLTSNDYVDFTPDINLKVKTYQLENGVDEVQQVSEFFPNAVKLNRVALLKVDDIVSFESEDDERYLISKIDYDNLVIFLDREPKAEQEDIVYSVQMDFNASTEAVSSELVDDVKITYKDTEYTVKIPQDAGSKYDLFDFNKQILNYADFEENQNSIAFSNTKSKLKIIGRNLGTWTHDLRICIAKPESFSANDYSNNHITHYAFEGIIVDDLFEYAPQGTEVGFIVYDDKTQTILEIFTVDFDKNSKDNNNKSKYIENVINLQSNYIYVKDNISIKDIADYTLVYDEATKKYVGKTLKLVNGRDSDIQDDDLLSAYEVFENKEELDIDIVIGNERDGGASVKSLIEKRIDCIGFIGCNYDDVVNKKAVDAVANLVNWRKFTINYNNMFMVACGNYKYQYDRYNDVYRWINIAGDIAGLRAETSANRASWWASAGLERGQVKNVVKLAFNPNQSQRDTLYKNGINPIVTFSGQGTVMWGQKTLLDKASSFDRVNVRGLFNYLERSLSKMAKYQVMELNDAFTRNSIVSMIKPFLSTVKSGRGVQDFLVVCDETNNTPQVIAQNQLIVDIYIKPTYVAEFILLRFTNAGTKNFSEIISG